MLDKPRLWVRARSFEPDTGIQPVPFTNSFSEESLRAKTTFGTSVVANSHSTVTTWISNFTKQQSKMSAKDSSAMPLLKKIRGVIRSSITRLASRLSVLGGKPPNRDTLEAAQRTLQRLNDLQAEFKVLLIKKITKPWKGSKNFSTL